MSCWQGFKGWCQTAYRFALAGTSLTIIIIYLVAYIMQETKHYTFARPLHYQSIVTLTICSVVNLGFIYVTFAYPPRFVGKLVVFLLLVSLITSGGSLSLAGAEWSQCGSQSINQTIVYNVTVVDDTPAPSPVPLEPSPVPVVILPVEPSPEPPAEANSKPEAPASPPPEASPNPPSGLNPLKNRGFHTQGYLQQAQRNLIPIPKGKLQRTFKAQGVLDYSTMVLDYSHPSCFLASLQCVMMVLYCIVATLQLFSIWGLKRKRPYRPIQETATPEAVTPQDEMTSTGSLSAKPAAQRQSVDASSARPSSKYAYR